MVLQLWIWQRAPCLRHFLPTPLGGQQCPWAGRVGHRGRLVTRSSVGAAGDAAAVALTQAAQVTPGLSPWCPKAECIGRGLQLMGKGMHNIQNSKENWPSRKRSMCTVFVSTALSHRTQIGNPKYLSGVSLNSFPLLLSWHFTLYIMSGWMCCDYNYFNKCKLYSALC